MNRSPMFENLKLRYEKKFVRKDQLQRYVEFEKLTVAEYKEITGEDFHVAE